MKLHAGSLALTLLLAGAVRAQEIDLQVELMGPLGTQTSHKGDRVLARVVTPGYAVDTVEGKVTDAKAGGKMTGNSVLSFTFETWQHAGQAIPIASQIKAMANSKGPSSTTTSPTCPATKRRRTGAFAAARCF